MDEKQPQDARATALDSLLDQLKFNPDVYDAWPISPGGSREPLDESLTGPSSIVDLSRRVSHASNTLSASSRRESYVDYSSRRRSSQSSDMESSTVDERQWTVRDIGRNSISMLVNDPRAGHGKSSSLSQRRTSMTSRVPSVPSSPLATNLSSAPPPATTSSSLLGGWLPKVSTIASSVSSIGAAAGFTGLANTISAAAANSTQPPLILPESSSKATAYLASSQTLVQMQHASMTAIRKFAEESTPLYSQYVETMEMLKPMLEENLEPIDTQVSDSEVPGVPMVFFEQDFDIFSSHSFQSVFGDSDPTIGSLWSERLSHYLDLVEQKLAREIGLRADAFFEALSDLQNLETVAGETSVAMHYLTMDVDRACRLEIRRPLQLVRLMLRRSKLFSVQNVLEQISIVMNTPRQVQSLIEAGVAVQATALIHETRKVLLTNLKNIACVRNMDVQLEILLQRLVTKSVDKLSQILVDCVENPVLSMMEANATDENLILSLGSEEQLQWQLPHWTLIFVDEATVMKSLMTSVRTVLVTRSLEATVQSYKQLVNQLIKRTIKHAFPTLPFEQNNGQPVTKSERFMLQTRHLRQMRHDTFFQLWWITFDRLMMCFTALIRVHALFVSCLKDVDSQLHDALTTKSLGATSPIQAVDEHISVYGIQHVPGDLDLVLLDAISFSHTRLATLLTMRAEVHAQLSMARFHPLWTATQHFVTESERLLQRVQRPTHVLRNALLMQARAHLNHLHGERLKKLSMLIESERWLPVQVTSEMAEPLLPYQLTVDTAAEMSCAVTKQGRKLFLTSVVFVLVQLTSDYLVTLENISPLAADILARLLELFKLFNTRSCQMILGAAAIKTAGLQSISSKHIALLAQSLDLVLLMLPVVRERVEQKLLADSSGNKKQAMISTEVETVQKDISTHLEELYGKLVAIMNDRCLVCSRQWTRIQWDLPDDPQWMKDTASKPLQALVKETCTLHRVLSRYLPGAAMKSIFSRIFEIYTLKMEQDIDSIDITSTAGKSRLLFDVQFMIEQFSALEGIDGPGHRLEVVVNAYKLRDPNVIAAKLQAQQSATQTTPLVRRPSLSQAPLPVAPAQQQHQQQQQQNMVRTSSMQSVMPASAAHLFASMANAISTGTSSAGPVMPATQEPVASSSPFSGWSQRWYGNSSQKQQNADTASPAASSPVKAAEPSLPSGQSPQRSQPATPSTNNNIMSSSMSSLSRFMQRDPST